MGDSNRRSVVDESRSRLEANAQRVSHNGPTAWALSGRRAQLGERTGGERTGRIAHVGCWPPLASPPILFSTLLPRTPARSALSLSLARRPWAYFKAVGRAGGESMAAVETPSTSTTRQRRRFLVSFAARFGWSTRVRSGVGRIANCALRAGGRRAERARERGEDNTPPALCPLFPTTTVEIIPSTLCAFARVGFFVGRRDLCSVGR